MPLNKKPNKRKNKTASEMALFRAVGGQKLRYRMQVQAQQYRDVITNPDAKARFVNFGLPDITDMEGPAEC